MAVDIAVGAQGRLVQRRLARQRAQDLRLAHCLLDSETGDRDQYQLYEILYATGDRAGVAGREDGAKWRHAAILDGVLKVEE